ncbi:HK97 gp10 family phage protein [Enterococcus sp. LJL90]
MTDTGDFESSVDAAVQEIQDLLVRNMDIALDVVADTAKSNVGVQTGALRADTRPLGVEIRGDEVVGAVGNSLEYAPYHHQGTGIYAVDGNGRKTPWVYKDPKTGDVVFTKGSKPNPYLKNAVEAEQGTIAQLLGGG